MTPEEHEWQRLVDGLLRGDERVVREFYQSYAGLLHGIADRQISPEMRRRFDADDVVQSTFRTLFRRAQGGSFFFHDNERLWSLLCAITLTKVRSKSRYHSRGKRQVSAETSTGIGSEGEKKHRVEPSASGLSPAERAEFADAFEQFLAALSPEERGVVELKLQDFTNDEVAEQLNVSERTVRRILRRLQERISHAFTEET